MTSRPPGSSLERSESGTENAKVASFPSKLHLQRHCFVTVGATASFRRLLEVVLSVPFTGFLVAHAFTHLTVQTATPDDQAWAEEQAATLRQHHRPNEIVDTDTRESSSISLCITTFQTKPSLRNDMQQCQAERGSRSLGVLVTHAGTGSILDAMTPGLECPLVVVANPSLAGNHQAEIAQVVHDHHLGVAATMSASSSSSVPFMADLQAAVAKAYVVYLFRREAVGDIVMGKRGMSTTTPQTEPPQASRLLPLLALPTVVDAIPSTERDYDAAFHYDHLLHTHAEEMESLKTESSRDPYPSVAHRSQEEHPTVGLWGLLQGIQAHFRQVS